MDYLSFGAACVVTPRPVFAYLEINLAQFWGLDLTNEVVFSTLVR